MKSLKDKLRSLAKHFGELDRSIENYCDICKEVRGWNLRELHISKTGNVWGYQCSGCKVYANEDTLEQMQIVYDEVEVVR